MSEKKWYLMKDEKWYPVPPYKNEGWKILNQGGELVAVFEEQKECELVCKLYNKRNLESF